MKTMTPAGKPTVNVTKLDEIAHLAEEMGIAEPAGVLRFMVSEAAANPAKCDANWFLRLLARHSETTIPDETDIWCMALEAVEFDDDLAPCTWCDW